MKHITSEMWTSDFNTIADVGDSVDWEIVEEFLTCVPPATHTKHLIQCGEPYSHRDDHEDGLFKPTFSTFECVDGIWYYRGHCFRNKTKAIW